MKVSILIPIYNADCYIERCLRSVFEQSYKDIEYVLIDDKSSDSSVSIIKKVINDYPNRFDCIKLYLNEINLGISKTRNKLLSYATGDYIYFVDSDDYIELNAVESFVSIVNETKACIIRSNYYECKNNCVTLKTNIIPINHDSYVEYAIKSVSSIDSLWKLFIKREIFVKNSLLFPSTINVCEDYIMTIKLFFYSKKIIDIESSFYYYTVDNERSITKKADVFNTDKIKSVLEVKRFLIDNHIYDKYKNALLYRMVMSKQNYLINKQYFNLDKYYKYFPEANSSWRLFNYGYRERILFWLAEYKLTFIIYLYYFIGKFK